MRPRLNFLSPAIAASREWRVASCAPLVPPHRGKRPIALDPEHQECAADHDGAHTRPERDVDRLPFGYRHLDRAQFSGMSFLRVAETAVCET